jgi:hypothetical protein
MICTPTPSEQKARLYHVTWRLSEYPKHWDERALLPMIADAVQFCNISFEPSQLWGIPMSNVPSQMGFVGLVESLMIFCDMVRRHPRLTTAIAPKYGAVRGSGPKHFKRIISNSSELIHTRGQTEPCNSVGPPTGLHELSARRHRIQTLHRNELL